MTARITPGQKNQGEKLVRDALTSLNPTKDGAQRALTNPAFQARFKQLFVELAQEFYLLLDDDEAIVWIVKQAGKSEAEALQIVGGWREKARKAGVKDNIHIHAEVQPGCFFKRDMPQMGPTVEDFQYLQSWSFPDTPTKHALVSWVPAPIAQSTAKDVSEQKALVASFKASAQLPAWYDVSIGVLNHVAGLSLAHFNATAQDPFAGLVVRTDTCDSGGGRLDLFWDQGRLRCDNWLWSGLRNSGFAVVALGVVEALGH